MARERRDEKGEDKVEAGEEEMLKKKRKERGWWWGRGEVSDLTSFQDFAFIVYV